MSSAFRSSAETGFAAVDLSETSHDNLLDGSWDTTAVFVDSANSMRKTDGRGGPAGIPLQGRKTHPGRGGPGGRRRLDEDDEYDDAYMDDVEDDSGLLGGFRQTAKKQAKHYLRKPWFLMCGLGLILGLIILSSVASKGGSIAPVEQEKSTGPTLLNVTLAHVMNGTFQAVPSTQTWITAGVDGSQSFRRGNVVGVRHVETGNETILMEDAKDPSGNQLEFNEAFISNDLEFVLVETDYEKGWRHSFFANYWLWSVLERKATPLATSKPDKAIPDQLGSGKISLALWSPTDNHVAWVRDNDIYVTLNANVEVRITHDGSKDLINGIADWVYEEEVLGTHDAMWFSTKGTHIAYLKFNESEVPEYKLPYYQRKQPSSYPEEIAVKYPKPGYPNPIVTLHIASPSAANASEIDLPVDLDPAHNFLDDDRIISDVTWVSDVSLLVRTTNRVQDSQRLFLVANDGSGAWKGKMVRSRTETDGGWITKLRPLQFVPPSSAVGRAAPSYVELMENKAGYLHLAYFSSVDSAEPSVWLTSGKWEVDSILGVDAGTGRVYYSSGEEGPTQRHIYSVRLDTEKEKLTPPKSLPNDLTGLPSWTFSLDGQSDGPILGAAADNTGWYSATFSPGCGYYVLDYQGPDVPWSRVIKVDSEWTGAETDNKRVRDQLPMYAMPHRSYIQIPTAAKPLSADDGEASPLAAAAPIPPQQMMNAILEVPYGFDRNGTIRYPVLMRVYGGPNSQLVQQRFGIDMQSAIVSAGGFISLTVDGRGTGFMGRAFRSSVASHLGSVEVDDQIAAAKWLGEQSFVDPERIAIWGWSYGGYMTSKVVEADSGLFKVGMAVAPVTDWMYYDSIYTERYMKTPRSNAEGYEKSAVVNMDGFKKGHFLLVHGTGDDNVHFQNSASLVYHLTGAHVRNYRVQFYTDSDHSMGANGANREVFILLWNFLNDAIWGPGINTIQ
ncbi:hypothetical protein HKX48_008887 [Thoreauomyces humboldtii]|nr:hypothetical protein HKX48_008887 [Thoreauomyces humboldtii]